VTAEDFENWRRQLSWLQLVTIVEAVGEVVVEAEVDDVEGGAFPATLQFRRSNATVPRIDTK